MGFVFLAQIGYTQGNLFVRGKPMVDLLVFVCIGLVIATILAVIVTLLLAYEEYKKTQKPPKE